MIACLMADMVGCGGGAEILFFRPAAWTRRDWRNYSTHDLFNGSG
jgi:hypothetical protein